ncbi:branched-chain-amino-acid transaminase [Candidatus Sumerlaeota bacterium]|nr:branched-chain-amino-acid transaminase [Candidatus Sumerlaeota bacterium]
MSAQPDNSKDPLAPYEDLIVFIDGEYVPAREAAISVFDHGLLYGDGIFEGIRLYAGCVFKLDEHLDRLYDSARYLNLTIPIPQPQMREVVCETCRRNGLTNGYIRLVVTRGPGTMGLAPWLCPRPSVVCIAASIQLYPKEYYEKGLEVVCAATRRTYIGAFNARCKSLNYLNNIMAKIEGHNAGCLEALMLDQSGFVIEATGDNVFLVKGGRITTPPTYQGNLRGITRDFVVELAREAGHEVAEEPITTFEVYTADECFLTGTAAEAIPVIKVDGRPIGDGKPGPITRALIAAFRARTATDGVMLHPSEAVRS